MVYFNKYFSLLAACIFPQVQTKPHKIIQRFITFGTDKLLDGLLLNIFTYRFETQPVMPQRHAKTNFKTAVFRNCLTL